MHKPLVLCNHQVHAFQAAQKAPPLPDIMRALLKSDAEVANWFYSLRSALLLASDCVHGCRNTTEGRTYAGIAQLIGEAVLERRGPEITEHDNYTRNITTVDEIPLEDDDEDDT